METWSCAAPRLINGPKLHHQHLKHCFYYLQVGSFSLTNRQDLISVCSQMTLPVYRRLFNDFGGYISQHERTSTEIMTDEDRRPRRVRPVCRGSEDGLRPELLVSNDFFSLQILS